MTPVSSETAIMLSAFQRGIIALEDAKAGNLASVEKALLHLHVCLEFALPDRFPVVWRETLLVLAEVYDLRKIGDPAVHHQRAKICRQKALL